MMERKQNYADWRPACGSEDDQEEGERERQMGCVWSSDSAVGKGVRMILVEEPLVIQILPYNLYFPHTKSLVKY